MLIETAPGSTDAASAAGGLRQLYWHPKVAALLPGTAAAPAHPAPGDGRLTGRRAWLPRPAPGAGDAPARLARQLGLTTARLRRDGTLPGWPRSGGQAPPPGRLPTRLYYWVGLTVTQPFNTGVQRVVRLLAVALGRRGVEVVAVKWDEAGQCLAPISAGEAAHLARWNGPSLTPTALPADLTGAWLLLPEITFPVVPAGGNQARHARARGMRVAALFYDLIPAIMADYYPPEVQTQFRPYWDMFAELDVALPISWTVAADIARYLAMRGLALPVITPCPLAGEFPATTRVRAAPVAAGALRLLAVGTWEPRKNYPRLLRALHAAQALAARPIELTIVGRRMDLPALNAEIESLAAGCGARHAADVTDQALRQLYAAADATVFASWEEGFGLPVLESLWHGRPCLCHDGSAMAEVAPGGGALAVDMLDEAAIAGALLRLADEPGLLQALTAAAAARPIRAWDDYAEDVLLALAT